LTVTELVANVILTATGENSTAVSGDDDWKKVLSLANLSIDQWAKEADWASLYAIVPIGTVTATDSFDLDDSIRRISNKDGDSIRINHTDGKNYTDYSLVAADELKLYSSGAYCAKIGSQLVFNNAFKSTDAQFGGTINVPAYVFADHLSADSDDVPVDDPNWLVNAVAAEWARTDLTLAQNYPLLLQKANDLMVGMNLANAPQVSTVPKSQVALGRSW
jgi:hypothetical protein